MQIARSPVVRRAADWVRPWYRRINPWTGLEGLDRRVVPYLPSGRGYFVEAGANDGLKQSNTYFLERRRGWTGLLVEPVPRLAERCRRNRSRSVVVNAALVGPGMSGQTIDLIDVDLMTLVPGSKEAAEEEAHIRAGEAVQGVHRRAVSAVGRTLTELIDQAGLPRVDFLSLDVEGFEVEVLSGLDLARHRPAWILVETVRPDAVAELLGDGFRRVARLSEHDWLFADGRGEPR